jgi:hypothetical protein
MQCVEWGRTRRAKLDFSGGWNGILSPVCSGWKPLYPQIHFPPGSRRKVESASSKFRSLHSLTTHRTYDQALRCLGKLHILVNPNVSPPKLLINTHFKSSFRTALTGGGNHMSFGVPAPSEGKGKDPDKRPGVSVEQLEWHAMERWEVSLGFACRERN